jgi:Rrf2 family nitric oxide-sensitive transcriptional repressor
MRLTTFTDYTLRVLIYIGLRPGQRATIAELADVYHISRNHLMKVVHHLGQTGYIETLRGKGGGFLLARAPEKINIGALIRDTEQRTTLVECFTDTDCDCRISPACRMKGMLNEALNAFYAVLDQYTLADLIRNKQQLERLLPDQTLAGRGPPT